MLIMLYNIIVSKTFYVVLLHHVSHVTCVTVTVTCDVTFCLLHLCPNKEKETQNKIQENKIKLK